MDISNDDNSDLIQPKPVTPRPVVLVLLDGWGIAPKYSGNVFANLKLKTFSSLVKNYPLALLAASQPTSKERYQILGANGLLSKMISDAGLSQLNLTESEKLLDSWFHFNGSRDLTLDQEELKVVSSKTGSRQENVKQSLSEIIKISLLDIKKGVHDFLVINLANLDLVSATGDLEASKDAAKLLDKDLGRLADAVLKQNGVLIVTAAYGHAESMINMATELPQAGITNNPVPFIIVSRQYQGRTIGLPDTLDDDLSLVESVGSLENVTPTILKILNIDLVEDLRDKSLL
jgi:2,3-bisphosphoglycerate-independent phosphoglycerate mutase